MHQDLYDYWCQITPSGRLPGRQHLDPLDIPRLLRWVILLYVDRTDGNIRFHFRLMGTGAANRSGGDATGLWLEEAASVEQFQFLNNKLRSVVTSGKPIRYINHSRIKTKEHIAIDTLALPLAGDGETVDMLLLLNVEPLA